MIKDRIYEILKEFSSLGYEFERDQIIISCDLIWEIKRKKIDFADFDRHVFIDVDGPQHFSSLEKGTLVLHQVQQRDQEFNNFIHYKNWTLIRISYNVFQNNTFIDGFIDNLTNILSSPKSGVFCLGDSYFK